MPGVQEPRTEGSGLARLTVRILGSVQAFDGTRLIPLGSSKARALLAILALQPDQVVSTEQLIEALWGNDAPPTASKMLQVQVSRLRRALGAPDAVVTWPRGYALGIPPEAVDLSRFDALAVAARRIPATEPGRAADALRDALGLWRGAPLADVDSEPFAAWAIPRLEELRLAVLEERLDLDLKAGRHRSLVAELRDLVAAQPFRERFVAQLMLALYRTGRQADALDVFRACRERLADELGIEPGPDLQHLQMAVLNQDPSLEVSMATGGGRVPTTATDQPAPPASRARGWTTLLRGSRPAIVVVASLAALAMVVFASRLGASPPRQGSEASPVLAAADSVAAFDPAANALVSDLPAGQAPGPIAAMGGNVWVGSGDDHTIARIDLASGRIVHTNGLAAAPTSLTAADGSVWIANGFLGTMSRILAPYDQLSAPFFPDREIPGLLAIDASNGDLWVGLSDGSLLRMDAASLRVQLAVQLQDRVHAITTSVDAAWTIQVKDHLVRRIGRLTGAVSPGTSIDGTPTVIAFGAGAVWVGAAAPNAVWQLDPAAGAIIRSYSLPFPPTGIVADDAGVWVIDGTGGTLEHLDPTGKALPTSVSVGRPIAGVAIANGELWLTIR